MHKRHRQETQKLTVGHDQGLALFFIALFKKIMPIRVLQTTHGEIMKQVFFVFLVLGFSSVAISNPHNDQEGSALAEEEKKLKEQRSKIQFSCFEASYLLA